MYICVKAHKNDTAPVWEKEMEDSFLVLSRIQAAAQSKPTAEPAPATYPPSAAAVLAPRKPEGTYSDMTGYTGFLLIKCEHCGKVKAYHARSATTEHICRDCGETTVLREGKMTTAEFYCPDCGNTWRYKTNIEDAQIQHRCLNCNGQMTARWDPNAKGYVTLGRSGGAPQPSKEKYWGSERRHLL